MTNTTKKELSISFRTYGEYIGFRIRPLAFPQEWRHFRIAIDLGYFAIVIEKLDWI